MLFFSRGLLFSACLVLSIDSAVAPTSAELSDEASKLSHSVPSESQSGIVTDVDTNRHNDLFVNPNSNTRSSSIAQGLLEAHGSGSTKSHRLKHGITQSHYTSVVPKSDANNMSEETHADVKMKEMSDFPIVSRNDEEDVHFQAVRSTDAEAASVNSGDITRSNDAHNSIGTNNAGDPRPRHSNSGIPPTSYKWNAQSSDSQVPNQHFGYHDPHASTSQSSNIGDAFSHQMEPSGPYRQTYAHSMPHPSWEWRLHWVDVLQPKLIYEAQKQLAYLPVQKKPTVFSSNPSFRPTNHFKSRPIGGLSSSPTGRTSYPRIVRPRKETAKDRSQIKLPNESDLQHDHSLGKELQKEVGESSGTEKASSVSEFQSKEATNLHKTNERSPSELLMKPHHEKEVDQSVCSEGSKISLEISDVPEAKNKYNLHKDVEEIEIAHTKTSSIESPDESFLFPKGSELNASQHNLNHVSHKQLKEIDINYSRNPSAPESLNDPAHFPGNFQDDSAEDEPKDLPQKKDKLADKGDLKASGGYAEVLASQDKRPSTSRHHFTASDEQADRQPGSKDIHFRSSPRMKPSSPLGSIATKFHPTTSIKQSSNLKQSSGNSPKKIIKEATTYSEEPDNNLGISTLFQPRNRFEILKDTFQDIGDEYESETSNQAEKKQSHIANSTPTNTPNWTSESSPSTSELRHENSRLLHRVRPYLESVKESTKNIFCKLWHNKPNLRDGITSIRFPSLSVKYLLQDLRAKDLQIPLKSSLFDILKRTKPPLSHPLGARTREASESLEPSTSLQKHGGAAGNSRREDNSFQDSLPIYVHDYLQANPAAGRREIEMIRVLGKFLQVDSNEPFPLIHLSSSDSDYESIIQYMKQQKNLEQPGGRVIKQLFSKIGETEGRRRWKALTRQYNQPQILLKWEKSKKGASSSFMLMPDTIKFLEKTLKLNEAWPTFYGSSRRDYWLLNQAMGTELNKKVVIHVLGKNELDSRAKNFLFMSHRLYPHDWLPETELKLAYQQGLDTSLIMIVGDLLQFGRRYFTLSGSNTIPDYQLTFGRLMMAWEKPPDEVKSSESRSSDNVPWGSSPEKAWFLSQPERAKIYESRIAYLKDYLKHDVVPEETLLNISSRNAEVTGKPWWNLADQLEWQEHRMDSATMVQIGKELNLPVSRTKLPDKEKLKEILEKQKVSLTKDMKGKIYDWFESNSYSPYTRSIFSQEKATLVESWMKCLDDDKSHLLSIWKQKKLYPQEDSELFLPTEII